MLQPFSFDVSMDGKVSASYKGHDVASVRLSLDLSGPTPWHAKGKAKFSVLAWDVSAHFNKTWGSDNRATLAKVDPRQPFLEELTVVGNWSSGLLSRRAIVESLKSLEAPVAPAQTAGDTAALAGATGTATADVTCTQAEFLVHPAGGLEFRQRYIPLDLKLDKVGNADVKSHFKFDVEMQVEGAGTAGPALDPDPVEEHFARGQYKSLSKSERLSKPSYERFKAGVRVAPLKARLNGTVQPCDLEYESIVIPADGVRSSTTAPNARWEHLRKTLAIAALRRAGVRNRGLGKFKTEGAPRVRLGDEGYVIVDKATLARVPGMQRAGKRMTQTQGEDVVSAAVSARQIAAGSVVVVPESEEAVA